MTKTIIDLTKIEDLSEDELKKWIEDLTTMYNTCINKGKIGAANAMYLIKQIVIDEINSRKEPF